MPTPHIAAELEQIAPVVLMPGDPLRAKVLSDTYLENADLVNEVRGILAFTGTYEGARLTVMASGMGVPSMGIYSYELYKYYNVQTIIRIGTAGGIASNVNVRDVIIAQSTCTDSNFAAHYNLPISIAPIGDFGLMRSAAKEADRLGVPYHVGNIVTTDAFYRDVADYKALARMGVLATEMETAALYLNAMDLGKKALGIMTISDHVMTGESLDAIQRQNSFTQMMEIALAVARKEALAL